MLNAFGAASVFVNPRLRRVTIDWLLDLDVLEFLDNKKHTHTHTQLLFRP